MVSMAKAIASSSASRVRALAARKNVLSLDQQGSIGEWSGEYGGRSINYAPAAAIVSRMPLTLCAPRLSMITMSPGISVGAKTWLT
jgi:hypothetical protein